MCNEYQLRVRRGDYDWQFSELNVPINWADAEPNRPLDRPFKPTNRATMIRAVDPADPMAGVEGLEARWWLVPFFHKGPLSAWKAMCTNARLETVDTTAAFREPYKRRRALIPFSSFIEYDEPPGWKKGEPKRRWEISWAPAHERDRVRFFAGLWDTAHPADHDGPLTSFTFVTGPPGPLFSTPQADTGKPLHSRQTRVLTLQQGMDWLKLDGGGKALLEDPEPHGDFVLKPRPRELEATD
ncbi:SOS response-associated peptidase family protein [Phenylobacterium ferrooxidans]|uniref:Abasic site processing protein n=1 Tax=Phenylobacterium ferrooxidans TaxID=2982689 RepID=A0ABW6CMJ5_9CAUL